MRVERSLLICFVARSGSWFLSGLLASTDVLGRPEEFFWAPDDRGESRSRRRSPARLDAERRLRLQVPARTVDRAARAGGSRGADVPGRELVERMFPNPLYVWLRREDTVAQAVSWSRAMQTGLWSTRNEGSGEPRYDHSEIAGLLDLIDAETDGWRTWFESQEIEPVVVTYERLLEAPHAEVGRIAAAAGVELPAGIALRPYPGWRRQANELNEEWIRRFRNEGQ